MFHFVFWFDFEINFLSNYCLLLYNSIVCFKFLVYQNFIIITQLVTQIPIIKPTRLSNIIINSSIKSHDNLNDVKHNCQDPGRKASRRQRSHLDKKFHRLQSGLEALQFTL